MAHNKSKIPRATLKRLPLYYRFVNTLKSKALIGLILRLLVRHSILNQQPSEEISLIFGELGKKATVTI